MQPTLPPALLAAVGELLAARLGLNFPAERRGDLERGLAAAAPALGLPDAAACAHRLLSAPLTCHEIEILAGCLTVGETYFFREQHTFEALEQHVLPPLLRERDGSDKRLRIWSAGCCTGEEPYSVAMLLDRLLPDADAWNSTLLATDINPAFLRKAAEGVYGAWSFRATPDWIRDRHFKPAGRGCYRLEERIRRRVMFSCLNLADDVYPSLTGNTNAMDIVFCRNVLMYFTPAQAARVVDKLQRSLVEGGWLIVSPAETSSVLFAGFTTVEFPGAIFYRRPVGAQAPRRVSHVVQRPEADFVPPWLAPAESAPAAVPDPLPPRRERLIRAARDCANDGRLDEAGEWCRQAIAFDKLDPALHYLLSVIEQERGRGDDAVRSLTRALYLAPDFVLAHYALGNLRQSQGRRREAQRHFDNALQLLQNHPTDEILPESDGLSAGRLAQIIVSMQAGMPRIADRA
ncbi:MAG: CheR family methyltransferase [Methyloversatilis sp.]|uniref:CheR family methyltransferase n=1 Tax=Methyloversatilis sp. TaxID=2569862 RepID=UPI0027350F36|nr:CheR family methyltransferase [Methyloversatilis sp.]MDP3874889.1 CheR family methyltransferase [Methyloversatilis sp.]